MTVGPDLSVRPVEEALAAGTLTVGRHTYGHQFLHLHHWGEDARLHIGAFCSISFGMKVFLGGEHRTDWVTTYPFTALPGWSDHIDVPGHPATKGDVVIGNDVWIGHSVTIMSGVTIGHGAAIGANATVASDVPPYTIVAGNPARALRTRFIPDQVERLLALAWWDWDDERIRANLHLLCSPDVEGLLASDAS